MAKSPTLSRAVRSVLTALTANAKAEMKVGDAVLAASKIILEADISPFCDAIKTSLEAKEFKPSSVKVTVMYIRRVLTAVIVDGVKVQPNQSLRGLYESLPKKKTGGATHSNKAKASATVSTGEKTQGDTKTPATLESRAEKVRASVTMIFGYSEPDLVTAVLIAAANVPEFIKWAKGTSSPAKGTGSPAKTEKEVVPKMEQPAEEKKPARKKREPVTA